MEAAPPPGTAWLSGGGGIRTLERPVTSNGFPDPPRSSASARRSGPQRLPRLRANGPHLIAVPVFPILILLRLIGHGDEVIAASCNAAEHEIAERPEQRPAPPGRRDRRATLRVRTRPTDAENESTHPHPGMSLQSPTPAGTRHECRLDATARALREARRSLPSARTRRSSFQLWGTRP